MWRQGDVLIERIGMIPKDAIQQNDLILAEGEVTGHCHKIKDSASAIRYADAQNSYLEIQTEIATVIHEDHDAITLMRGAYRVWRQREYTPEGIRTVLD